MHRLYSILLVSMVPLAVVAEPSSLISPNLSRLDPALHARATSPQHGDEVDVILHFADRPNPRSFRRYKHKRERRHRMVTELKSRANDAPRQAMRSFLHSRGGKKIKSLWLANGIAVTVPTSALTELAQWSSVERIQLDIVVHAPTPNYSAATPVDWNLTHVHAPDVWELGYTGAGVTVAIFDTGVDATHPDLQAQYRGGTNSWYDPYGEHATPYDPAGHGTAVAGIAVGRNSSGITIGVAPDANWIAAKIFNDAGLSQLSNIHQAFQWALDPDGDPATDDAPDVINGSWGFNPGECINEFDLDLQTLKAAGIAVVFSAGNSGPGDYSTVSPGNTPGTMSVGMFDSNSVIASSSSRGPSRCDDSIDPELSAPGVGLYTADTTFGTGRASYANWTGTSFAAPHVAGAMALVLSAKPDMTVDQLELILRDTANDLGTSGPDYDFGYGALDVYKAVAQLISPDAPIATPDAVTTAEDVAIQIDVLANDISPGGGTLTLESASTTSNRGGAIVQNSDGTVTYTPPLNFNGNDQFAYGVSVITSGGEKVTKPGTVTVTVTPVNDPPVAVDDSIGVISADATGVYQWADPGVLVNDSDVDGDPKTAVLVSNVAVGSVQLRPAGGFIYTPPATGFPSGELSFTYRASDGLLSSNVATVRFTPNRAPVAQNDSITLSAPVSGKFTVAAPGVLANDTDPDGNAISAILVTNVSQGSVVLEATGRFVYTLPASGIPVGPISFTYRVSDGYTFSNIATATLTFSNRAPQANNDDGKYLTLGGGGRYELAGPGILANDTDPDGDTLVPSLVQNVATGSVQLTPDGGVVYTPPSTGTPSGDLIFTYRVSDGLATSNVATVRFRLNHAPVANEDSAMFAALDADATRKAGVQVYAATTSVMGNDSDADNDVLLPTLVSNVSVGKVNLTSNGQFTYEAPLAGAPSQPLTFTYQLSDGKSVSAVTTVTFTLFDGTASGTGSAPSLSSNIGIGYSSGSGFGAPASYSAATGGSSFSTGSSWDSWTDSWWKGTDSKDTSASKQTSAQSSTTTKQTREEPVARNEATGANIVEPPPRIAARDDQFILDDPNEKGQYIIEAPGVLANDDPGKNGQVVLDTNVRFGRLALRPDGGMIYTPPPNGMPPEVSFTYRLRDGSATSEVANVTLRQHAPVITRPDQFVLTRRNAKGAYVIDAPGVLANDEVPARLRPVLVQKPTVGTVELAADGSFTFMPPPGWVAKAPLSFTYRLAEGKHTSRSATVVLTIPQGLAAQDDSLVLSSRDAQGRYVLAAPGVLANDSGQGRLQAIMGRNVTQGSVSLSRTGAIVYTPPASGPPKGPLLFTYKVSDGSHMSKEATVRLTVVPPKASGVPKANPTTSGTGKIAKSENAPAGN